MNQEHDKIASEGAKAIADMIDKDILKKLRKIANSKSFKRKQSIDKIFKLLV